jgi:hypothetical protein
MHTCEGLDSALNLGRGFPDRTEHKLDPERRSRGLGCTLMVNVIGGCLGIHNQSGARKARAVCVFEAWKYSQYLDVMVAAPPSQEPVLAER